MLGFEPLRCQRRELCFVKGRTWKRQRKAFDSTPCLSRKRSDRAGIQPAGKKQTHWHVGDQMFPDCVFEKGPQFLRRRRKIARPMHVPRRGRNRRVPPGTRARRTAPLRHMHQHAMPRRKRKHSFHKRNRFRDASKKQIGGHGILRQSFGNGARRKQRSNFRGKGESVRRLRVIERLDTQRVARQE